MRYAAVPRLRLAAPTPRAAASPSQGRGVRARRAAGFGMGLLSAALGLGLLSQPAAAQAAGGAARDDKSCAQLGAGFQKVPGSDSCVRVRSGVRVDAFGAGTLSSAPGQGGPTNLGTTTDQPADPWKTAR